MFFRGAEFDELQRKNTKLKSKLRKTVGLLRSQVHWLALALTSSIRGARALLLLAAAAAAHAAVSNRRSQDKMLCGLSQDIVTLSDENAALGGDGRGGGSETTAAAALREGLSDEVVELHARLATVVEEKEALAVQLAAVRRVR